MTTSNEKVFDAFVRVWSVWWSGVPDRLARQESSFVVRLLTLGLREGGISQSELKLELGIAQPRLSKLMAKLLKEKWIEVKSSKTDGRIGLMTTTVKAQGRMAPLKQDLETLLQAQAGAQPPAAVPQSRLAASRRRKGIKPQPGQTKFEIPE
jgi:hypothetical protein